LLKAPVTPEDDFEEFEEEFDGDESDAKDPFDSPQGQPIPKGKRNVAKAPVASPKKPAVIDLITFSPVYPESKASVMSTPKPQEDDLFSLDFVTTAPVKSSHSEPMDLLAIEPAGPAAGPWLFKETVKEDNKQDDMLMYFDPVAEEPKKKHNFDENDPWALALDFTNLDDLNVNKTQAKRKEEETLRRQREMTEPKLGELAKNTQNSAVVMYDAQNYGQGYVPYGHRNHYYPQQNAIVLYGQPGDAPNNVRWN